MTIKKQEEKKSKPTQAVKIDEPLKFNGKFINALGKRKTAVAQVRLYKNGKGIIAVNDKKITQYFTMSQLKTIVNQPLKLTGHLRDINLSILVKGGGQKSQAEAVRHGITRSLIKLDKELQPSLKAKGWLTRDSRRKERKKPGLKKARRAPQWSKR